MARDMPGTPKARSVGRPAQGRAVVRQIDYNGGKTDPAPRVVSRGTVSRPVPLGKWNPSLAGDAANQTPRVVSK